MRLVIAILFVLLAGCANTVPKFTEADEVSGNLARIKSGEAKVSASGFYPSVHSVYDKEGNEIARMGYMNKINDIYLEPGMYMVVLLCNKGNTFAHPSIAVNLDANKEYEIFCEIAEMRKSIFGFDLVDSLKAKIIEIFPNENQQSL